MKHNEIKAFARQLVKIAAEQKLSVSDFQYALNEARKISLNSPIGLSVAEDTADIAGQTGLTGIISAARC